MRHQILGARIIRYWNGEGALWHILVSAWGHTDARLSTHLTWREAREAKTQLRGADGQFVTADFDEYIIGSAVVV